MLFPRSLQANLRLEISTQNSLILLYTAYFGFCDPCSGLVVGSARGTSFGSASLSWNRGRSFLL
ncbi:hypothetical protein NA56DRAFT_344458 [Hyaloscypha hepaticicola]|uniref:Uncharacterized protein n=1 Tax=Hyaloscypha hepaticicola TaxID=2082293 RepID=A0A2J6QJG7_9HELO|nr:hypothetical protein NA56DRAFT_344458 [Hyaloscypha hepaticicola]